MKKKILKKLENWLYQLQSPFWDLYFIVGILIVIAFTLGLFLNEEFNVNYDLLVAGSTFGILVATYFTYRAARDSAKAANINNQILLNAQALTIKKEAHRLIRTVFEINDELSINNDAVRSGTRRLIFSISENCYLFEADTQDLLYCYANASYKVLNGKEECRQMKLEDTEYVELYSICEELESNLRGLRDKQLEN